MERNTQQPRSRDETAPVFGDLLRRHRRAAGLTQEALAERAGLSARAITALERGVNRAPRSDTLQLLEDALDLSAEDRLRFEAAARRGIRTNLNESSGIVARSHAATELVGRLPEREALERHLNGEGPPMMFFAGEPGIGKSRLLHEAMRLGSAAGLTVLAAGCDRWTGQDLYSPLAEALGRSLLGWSPKEVRRALHGCGWLVRLLPELGEVATAPYPLGALPPEQERRLVFNAAVRFLTNLAGPRGVLLVLDDLQWAGSDALALLDRLLRSSASIPLRVVCAYRHTEVDARHPLSALFADASRDGLLTHSLLSPLSTEEAGALLRDLLADTNEIDERVRQRILERAEGVPLFVVSCARRLREGASPDPAEDLLPWDLVQVVRQQIASLPQPTLETLEVAALAGRAISISLVADALRIDEETVLLALERAGRAGMVDHDEERGHRFAHDVIREVIEAGLEASRRTLLHRGIAAVLEALPDRERRAADLAWHFAQGGESARALPWAMLAGGHAESSLAYGDAERQYRLAVRIANELGDMACEARALDRLGRCLRILTRYREAHAALERAAQLYQTLGQPEEETRTAEEIAHVLGVLGSHRESLDTVRATLSEHDQHEPATELVPLLIREASSLALLRRVHEALGVSRRAVDIARGLQDDQLLAHALYCLGSLLVQAEQPNRAISILEEVMELTERLGDLDTLYGVCAAAADAHRDRRELRQAKDCLRRGLAVTERLGDPERMGMGAWQLYWLDEWDEAERYFERALALSRERGDSPDSCARHLIYLGELRWARGDGEQAKLLLQEGLARAERSGEAYAVHFAHLVLAELDIQESRPGSAIARLEKQRAAMPQIETPAIYAHLAEAYLAAGEPDTAVQIIENDLEPLLNVEVHWHMGQVYSLRAKGMVLSRLGRREEAVEAFERAIALGRKRSYSFILARTLYDYGLMAIQEGRPEQARPRLEEALAIFRRLGARAHMIRTEEALDGSTLPITPFSGPPA